MSNKISNAISVAEVEETTSLSGSNRESSLHDSVTADTDHSLISTWSENGKNATDSINPTAKTDMFLSSIEEMMDSICTSIQEESCSSLGPYILRCFFYRDGDGVNLPVHVHENKNENNSSANKVRDVATTKGLSNNLAQSENTTPLVCILSDGTFSCDGLIMNVDEDIMKTQTECVISITGFIMGVWSFKQTSEIHPLFVSDTLLEVAKVFKQVHLPRLYITQYKVVVPEPTDQIDEDTQGAIQFKKGSAEKVLPRFSNELFILRKWHKWDLQMAFVRSLPNMNYTLLDQTKAISFLSTAPEHNVSNDETWKEDAATMDVFIEEHNAVMTLQRNQRDSESTIGPLLVSNQQDFAKQALQNYTNSLLEFDRIQQEKEVESIKEFIYRNPSLVVDSDECTLTLIQFKESLQYALTCKDESLSPELLVRWHYWLLGDGLCEDAGKYRDFLTGSTLMSRCEPHLIPSLVIDLCDYINASWSQRIHAKQTSSEEIARFAATALIGILALCPFCDGNQRFAKILLHWAFRKCGIPFTIPMYDCVEELSIFESVVQATLWNLSLITCGDAQNRDLCQALNATTEMAPIICFLLRRMARASNDLSILIRQKARCMSDESNARIVRRAREMAAQTACFVCLEAMPNISTLCCGKPVHFNCLAEWLSSHSSCPQCRSSLPCLSTRELNPFNSADTNNEEEDVEVGRLLSYIAHASLNPSSSESSSSSSISSSDPETSETTSSSSSTNPTYPYNNLNENLRFVSSDEEEEESNEVEDEINSIYRWVSESDDDSEDQQFFNADLAPIDDSQVRAYEGSMTSSISSVEDGIDHEHGDANSPTIAFLPSPTRVDGFSESEIEASRDGGVQSNHDENRTLEFITPTPRLSFLDPSLLVNVRRGSRNQNEESLDSYYTNVRRGNNYSGDNRGADFVSTYYARPTSFSFVSPESIAGIANGNSEAFYDGTTMRSPENPTGACIEPRCYR